MDLSKHYTKIVRQLNEIEDYGEKLYILNKIYINTICQGKAGTVAKPSQEDEMKILWGYNLNYLIEEVTKIIDLSNEEFVESFRKLKEKRPDVGDTVDELMAEMKAKIKEIQNDSFKS